MANHPDEPVSEGRLLFGRYDRPFNRVDLARPPGAGPLARMRLKEWQHYALVHPDVYISLALVDAKFLAATWVFAFDRRSDTSFEHSRNGPFPRLSVPASLFKGAMSYHSGGYQVEVRNRLEEGCHEIDFNIGEQGGRPSVTGSLRLRPDGAAPLVAVLPLPHGKPFYSLKTPLTLEGRLGIGSEEFAFDPARDLGLLDEHKAHYPRKTFWQWATFAAMKDGTPLGVNLTRNVIVDDEKHNENGLWVDGRIEPLGPARFDIPDDPSADWTIRTLDHRANLRFSPKGERYEDMNRLIARSRYRQPVGFFNGEVVDERGHKHAIKDAFGVAEDHEVTW